jgi:glucosyl-3-phosphoglycerate phosphatase
VSRRLVLWRHGRTQWNEEGRFQGHTNIPLDASGVAEAQRAARLLASLRPVVIVSSDLSRASATAAELANVTGLQVMLDGRLRERYGGEWEGLTGPEIAARYPETYAAWRSGADVQPEGGEANSEVADRVVAVLDKVLGDLPDDGILVAVSHGGAIRAGIGRLLQLPVETWSALGALSNCSWSVVSEGGRGWRLLEHNAGTLPEPVLGDDR